MDLYELVQEYLSKDIEVQFTWPAPVSKRDEESWINDTEQAFANLTAEDIDTAFKWCTFSGSDDEAIVAAIKSLILPEDLPIGCHCNITFIPHYD
jgi:hypothetical protein